MQNTIISEITFAGFGLHSGTASQITIKPAKPNHGISFRRTDIHHDDNVIMARWDAVNRSPLCTTLRNGSGVSVATVEHLMAALAGCGIHNAMIDINSAEVPIMDGSAAAFMRGLVGRGIRGQGAPLKVYEVLQRVSVTNGIATAFIEPSDTLHISFAIDFETAAIGKQEKTMAMDNGSFARELCDSRTFCSDQDVKTMQANGLALGGISGENAVVFDGGNVLSPGGLRYKDEPVRHKMLDALGDLYLAGAPLLGRYRGYKAGHTLTNTLLRKLFATAGAIQLIVCDSKTVRRLPGYGLMPNEIPASS